MALWPLRTGARGCSLAPRAFSTIAFAPSTRPRVGSLNGASLALLSPSSLGRTTTDRQLEYTPLPSYGSRRTLFGIGEILGVITNPGEVLRSLAESKKLLEEARQEMQENNEKKQIPVSHTFSPLPGFYPRPNELKALERALGAVPSFTVLFGASSVGKTALCRQVLSSEQFHCIHFDLRLAGFADLSSLYFSLAQQMEGYFATLPELMGEEWGWGAFTLESYAFKHFRLDVEKRIKDGGTVKTADIARLMELFQSALLKYWQFEPMTEGARKAQEAELLAKKEGSDSNDPTPERDQPRDPTEAKMRQGAVPSPSKEKEIDLLAARTLKDKSDGDKAKEKNADVMAGREDGTEAGEEAEEQVKEEPKPPPKKVPVFFLDEAHKLPALIQAEDAMKTLLDSMLVLTKQDRLCHVIHATSDPFYMHWLRQMNVMQHANIISIGDCSKKEAEQYFEEVLAPHVPDKLRSKIRFEELYDVFGGKLAHLADYTSEFINSDGDVQPLSSSHFLQAHSLLNLQLIHSDPSHRSPGFEIYSSLKQVSPHAAPSPFHAGGSEEEAEAEKSTSDFSARDLLLVMSRLAPPAPNAPPPKSLASSFGAKASSSPPSSDDEDLPLSHLQYFPLCRELGARSVDGMVRGRILELRWSKTVTPEGDRGERPRGAESRGVHGPVLVPTTPVVRRAMREVLQEYEEEGWLLEGLGKKEKAKEGEKGSKKQE
ncbi:hypothetical protein BCR35DRAFT_276955 [Leucosporidium creatinivorum]|uniref:AAA+ ATPase domain-containing protein n=1 Tax=Leucosporidium creatinivorum TaxID=106004 RepID=A0A1Y2FWB0_9BASI|nr:hypothetical protein BCR35DRAFT_276955 [Leucosporidium creatinivorum]